MTDRHGGCSPSAVPFAPDLRKLFLNTILPRVLLAAATATAIIGACASPAPAEAITLPRFFEPEDTLRSCCLPKSAAATQAWFGAAGLGSNNLRPLREITSDSPGSRHFARREAFAVLERRRWLRIRAGEWLAGAGRGIIDTYSGNNNAGQLWLDLHSLAERTRASYSPEADQQSAVVSWAGVGRVFALKTGRISGHAEVWLRYLTAEDYLSRAIEGNLETVPAESFSGMIRITDAAGQRHSGYSVDFRATADLGNDWVTAFSAEGLLGRIDFDGIYVQDAFFTSARVFEDRNGFLRDYGGITGAAWRENTSMRIDPVYRADVVRKGKPHVFAGFEDRQRARREISVGAAFPQSGGWMPYARLILQNHRLEVGATGTGWSLRFAADSVSGGVRNAEAAFSFAAMGF